MTLGRRTAVIVAVSLAMIGLLPTAAQATPYFVECAGNTVATRINFPYYPYNFCFMGTGGREVNIPQPYNMFTNVHGVCLTWVWNGQYYTPCLIEDEWWYAPSPNVTIVYITLY